MESAPKALPHLLLFDLLGSALPETAENTSVANRMLAAFVRALVHRAAAAAAPLTEEGSIGLVRAGGSRLQGSSRHCEACEALGARRQRAQPRVGGEDSGRFHVTAADARSVCGSEGISICCLHAVHTWRA